MTSRRNSATYLLERKEKTKAETNSENHTSKYNKLLVEVGQIKKIILNATD